MLLPCSLLAGLGFAGGALFGYFCVFAPLFRFLLGYSNEWLEAMPTVEEYSSLALRLFLAFGFMFDLPVALTLLARLGVVDRAFLTKNRKYAVLLAFVAAAMLTPSPDLVNQCLAALPIMLLYECGIWAVALFGGTSDGERSGESSGQGGTSTDSAL